MFIIHEIFVSIDIYDCYCPTYSSYIGRDNERSLIARFQIQFKIGSNLLLKCICVNSQVMFQSSLNKISI
jgi:hypothetical protein